MANEVENIIESSNFEVDKQTPTEKLATRLKAAREQLGFEIKDVAAQLRLGEKIILMLETANYPAELSPAFIRGYMKAYGKFLQIPDEEIQAASVSIKLNQFSPKFAPKLTPYEIKEVTSSNYLMQGFTIFIILLMAGLVGMWFYKNHLPRLGKDTPIEKTLAPAASVPTSFPPLIEQDEATLPPAEPTQEIQEAQNQTLELKVDPESATPPLPQKLSSEETAVKTPLANKTNEQHNNATTTNRSVPAYALGLKPGSIVKRSRNNANADGE